MTNICTTIILDVAHRLIHNLVNIDDVPGFFVLTPWSRVLMEKPRVIHLLKNFPAFYGTRSFITVFTRISHWSLYWLRWIHSVPPHLISLRSILMFFSSLRLDIPTVLSLWLSHQKACIHSSSPHTYYMPCPSLSPWLDESNYVWRRAKFMKPSIMMVSPTSYYLSLCRPKYSLQHALLKCS
jgi:hypothetical protein